MKQKLNLFYSIPTVTTTETNCTVTRFFASPTKNANGWIISDIIATASIEETPNIRYFKIQSFILNINICLPSGTNFNIFSGKIPPY